MSESGTAQTMANDPMKPLPIWRYEMTIDPKANRKIRELSAPEQRHSA